MPDALPSQTEAELTAGGNMLRFTKMKTATYNTNQCYEGILYIRVTPKILISKCVYINKCAFGLYTCSC